MSLVETVFRIGLARNCVYRPATAVFIDYIRYVPNGIPSRSPASGPKKSYIFEQTISLSDSDFHRASIHKLKREQEKVIP